MTTRSAPSALNPVSGLLPHRSEAPAACTVANAMEPLSEVAEPFKEKFQ